MMTHEHDQSYSVRYKFFCETCLGKDSSPIFLTRHTASAPSVDPPVPSDGASKSPEKVLTKWTAEETRLFFFGLQKLKGGELDFHKISGIVQTKTYEQVCRSRVFTPRHRSFFFTELGTLLLLSQSV